jgi:hypothetical protein
MQLKGDPTFQHLTLGAAKPKKTRIYFRLWLCID